MSDTSMKYFMRFVIGVVSLAILAGFFVAGSPTKQRMARFDQTRVNDLQSLQYSIIYYWQAKQKLPTTLADMNDSTRGVIVPKDPETEQDYEYSIKDPLSFSLCAVFNTASDAAVSEGRYAKPVPAVPASLTAPEGIPMQDVWSHGAGRVCFDRTIDTDFYRPLDPPVKPQT